MRIFILAIGLLFSTISLASGKITLKQINDVDEQQKKTRYMLGLSVYEKVYGKVAYEGWFGRGLQQDARDEDWMKTEQGLSVQWKAISVGVGMSYLYTPATEEDLLSAYSKVSLNLW